MARLRCQGWHLPEAAEIRALSPIKIHVRFCFATVTLPVLGKAEVQDRWHHDEVQACTLALQPSAPAFLAGACPQPLQGASCQAG